MKPQSLAYKYIPLEQRQLCRRVLALQEHRKRCKAANRNSVAALRMQGNTGMVYTAQWSVVLDEGSPNERP